MTINETCKLLTKRENKNLNPKAKFRKLIKAVVNTRYGPPNISQIKEIKAPTPMDYEVLIKVHTVLIKYNKTTQYEYIKEKN